MSCLLTSMASNHHLVGLERGLVELAPELVEWALELVEWVLERALEEWVKLRLTSWLAPHPCWRHRKTQPAAFSAWLYHSFHPTRKLNPAQS